MKHSQNNKQEYPIVRYLSILLAVALLFSGVTFARYALSRNESVNTGIAKYDASYTIDGVNSVAFGNSSYWMDIAGAWYEQGSARTVRVKMQNNSDVNVRAKTLHMEGPADFWENIALQLMTAKDDGTAENIITTQYVLADFLREKTGGSKDDHDIKYGGYKSWGENGSTFNTADSDEFGQRDNVEENLTVTGGIKDESGKVSGSVIITRGKIAYTGGGSDLSGYEQESEPLTIIITASMKTVEYSVGFARKQENNLSMPAFYLDCVKTVPYYSIDITLPETDYFNMTTEKRSTSLIAFLTWTNSDLSQELETQLENAGQDNFSVPETFRDATVIGYHFNYNDVPTTTEGETTTVRMNKATNGTITWQHIASLSEAEAEDPDGVYAHDIVDENGDPVKWKVSETLSGTYSCRGQTPGTSGGAVSFSAETLMGLKGDFSSEEFVKADSQDNCTASEKGYAVSFSVYFEQSSELPPSDTTP